MKPVYFLVLALAACTRSADQVPVTATPADSADMIYAGMKTRITKSGVLVSDVWADSAWYYQVTSTADLKGLRVQFTDTLGRVQSIITSKRGTFRSTLDQVLDARDSVVAVTPSGDTLRTSHLLWDKGSNLITSDTAFTFKSPDKAHPGQYTKMSGASFESTPDFKSVHILKAKGRQVAPSAKGTPSKAATSKGAASRGKGGG